MTRDMLLRQAAELGVTEANASACMSLAIGRILRLGGRPEQPGDAAQYEAARRVVLTCADVLGIQPKPDYRP